MHSIVKSNVKGFALYINLATLPNYSAASDSKTNNAFNTLRQLPDDCQVTDSKICQNRLDDKYSFRSSHNQCNIESQLERERAKFQVQAQDSSMYSTNTSPAEPTIMSPTPSLSRSDVAATDVPSDLT
jgi:hypothetical protein